MCAQFTVKINPRKLSEFYSARFEARGINPDADLGRIVPKEKAPIVILKQRDPALEFMDFSLIPSWSKEKRIKFATHNARLETVETTGRKTRIFEKPTWREPFTKRHALIPLTDFVEPIYTGNFAGNMVRFSGQSDEILTAAGIWDEWRSKDGEVIESFSIITDDPVPFVEATGHDRSPLFLKSSSWYEWLNAENMKPAGWVEFLRLNKEIPHLIAVIDRPLKAGWEKRI